MPVAIRHTFPRGGRWQPEGLTDEECGQKADDLSLTIRLHTISSLSPFLTRHGSRRDTLPPGEGIPHKLSNPCHPEQA